MVNTVILGLTIVYLLLHIIFTDLKAKKLPPGPLPWPIIGSHLLLKRLSAKHGGMHVALMELCKQYRSDVITLYFGPRRGLIISGNKLVRVALKNENFDGRPSDVFTKLRTFGKKQGIAMNDGPAWKELRGWMIASLKDFGYGKRSMSDLITEELVAVLENLKDGGVRTLKPIIVPAAINVLWNFTIGKHIDGASRLQYLIDLMDYRAGLIDLTGGIFNILPCLRYVAPEATGYKHLVRVNDELKNFFMDTINEHKKNYVPGRVSDVIDKFILEMMEKHKDNPHYTEEQLLVMLMDLFIAGFATIGTALDFLFLNMVMHQDVQRKLQKEIDSAIPSDKHPDIADRLKFPYGEAVINETLRMWPLFPLLPRRAVCDTQLGDYRIPKDTTVLINNYSVNRDPELYPEPDLFKPERHIENGVYKPDVNSLTFGMGRRKCPGAVLAKTATFIIFLGVIQKFTLLPVPGKEPKSVEIVPGSPIVLKSSEVLLVPR
ncbi:methyl farnesoate epoxidase-like [Augochlora pura]